MASNRKNKKQKYESVPASFARKYISYYYGFFWLMLILYLIFNEIWDLLE